MSEELPQHIAIIMDGNGRWAQKRGLVRTEGHRAGARAVRRIVTQCRKIGIKHLTLYTFSQENWKRPQEEVSTLFALLVEFLTQEVPLMVEQSITLHVLGDQAALPLVVRKALHHAIERTAMPASGSAQMHLHLALNYSGRHEILRAARKLIEEGVRAEDVTEQTFKNRLYTKGLPDPDLVIRTSGEVRISNYLLFQCAYSEFYFCPTLWPDFTEEDLSAALESYAHRNRRYGKTQEQVI